MSIAPQPTFTTPPLDGSLCISQIYDFHAYQSPNYPLFRYDSSYLGRHELTWGIVALGIHGAAKMALENVKLDLDSSPAGTTVGILAVADSITYLTHLFGVMRAGFTPFPISPRNSPTATSHLLTQTGTKFLYVSRDRATCDIVSSLLAVHTSDLRIIDMPTFHDLYNEIDHSPLNHDMLPPMITPDMLSPCLVLHSSGTTAFPKPITYSHEDLLQFARLPSTGEMSIPGQVHAMHAVPMFHAMGMTSMSRAAVAAMVIAVFEPRIPPMMPSPVELLKGISREECTILPCVPSFLEGWSSDSHAVEILKSLKAVIFAGGPLSHAVGDYLTSQGIQLYTVYGGTEFGTVSMMLPEEPLRDKWEYFYLSPSIDVQLIPWEIPDVFELTVVETPQYIPMVASCHVDGKKAYETKDLLIRHPRDRDLWKVYGRCDDQIMLSTGEKTNPGPIEYIFCKDPRIAAAVMFGRGRLFNGIILELAPPYRFDGSDTEHLAMFRTSISGLVEEANTFAPAHSRIYEEMILVANSAKTFDYTLKGTPRRHSILAAHQAEIDAAYAEFELTSAHTIAGPFEWNLANVVNWTQGLLQCVLRCQVPYDVDVFWLGCDSLKALRIRSIFASVLQNAHSTDHLVHLPPDFVYRHPTAHAMANALVSCMSGNPTISSGTKTAEMADLVRKMSEEQGTEGRFKPPAQTSEVVLLTGTTGSLGSHILYHLHQCKDVRRIYALNRGHQDDPDDLRRRQEDALKIRGITPEILRDGKVALISSDLASENLGLELNLFQELQNSVDLIVHTAWPVNFNYTLTSYTRSLQGLQNLINFARYTTSDRSPRFIYTSSVSVLKNWSGGSPVPEVSLPDPEVAVGLGYAESKWTAEQSLGEAADRGLRVSIIRIGQLSGSPNGYWNRNEWFPAIVQVANILKCLPRMDTQLFPWIPVDLAAAAIVEMRSNLHRYVHLANPRPVHSALVLQEVASLLQIPIVRFEDWLGRLNAAPKDTGSDGQASLDRVSIVLNSIIEDIARRPIEMDLTNGLQCSTTLRNSPQIDRKEVSQWLRAWVLI
ncbi:hypothetical protein PAXRUDRAFT_806336 [Paxillus rubicundulus Ve08.2h10]|uniref:Uncharacterized protein n=1 Tax=Paxillus rubicundulus Ve08.2h10 TaxID=930991 RepID=A0A0D0DQV3_9AGAM|nr:hypothetical protein PAXRUDRAFT_806336 [Paxillus rubicundulus Ve08.2h10]